MRHRTSTLAVLLLILLVPVAAQTAPAEDAPPAAEALLCPAAELPAVDDPVASWLASTVEEPQEPACKDVERDICNCNSEEDCAGRCPGGRAHCLIALACSEYPCVGSCRCSTQAAEPEEATR